jgi:hypothetical protein
MTDEELIQYLRTTPGWPTLGNAAADRIEALIRERDRAIVERDKALRRRDAWKARAEGHTEIVNALKAKTAGKDSRTLSRALLGAAFNQCEAERDALAKKLERTMEALLNAVFAWEEHQSSGDPMEGWWVSDARATLAAIQETPTDD